MWIKDVRHYEIEVHENGNIVYSGNVHDAPEEIKEKETKSMKIDHKKIVIEI